MFVFKQKTAYEMRISDWSSDVCSSDLFCACGALASFRGWRRFGGGLVLLATFVLLMVLYTTSGAVALQALEVRFARPATDPESLSCIIVLGGALENEEIGRASCRERVCQYV